ncbi:MAG TPA: molybdate ABC transporter substrate-binding protein [Candidatus Polarisedimenticolia bacterium]
MRVVKAVRVLAFMIPMVAQIAAAPPAGADGSANPELTIYAAASLRDVLQELEPKCGAALGARLVFNFGASNDLARQIIAANKADLFFSADEAWMDRVAEAGLLDGPSRRSPLSNRLCVIAPADGALVVRSAADLAGVRRLSLANPDAVPAGKYAKAWLEKSGAWAALENRVIPALDVRSALAAVESGGAEAGIVYRTDAAISRKVRIIYEVPETEGPRISYPIAALKDRPRLAASRAVAACLSGPESGPVFEKFGFIFKPQPR